MTHSMLTATSSDQFWLLPQVTHAHKQSELNRLDAEEEVARLRHRLSQLSELRLNEQERSREVQRQLGQLRAHTEAPSSVEASESRMADVSEARAHRAQVRLEQHQQSRGELQTRP
eukprot:4682511-Pleurochrysis_carterae.AAC.1